MLIKHILVIEDSITQRTYLQRLLVQNNFEVSLASNGQEGIEKAKAVKPDLILIDVVMPGMNGFQATRVLSKDPETKHVPVFICTKKGEETDRIWGLRQGAKDYLVKPIDDGVLLKKIAALG
jgi:twitching motility two-component system response regulator PilH